MNKSTIPTVAFSECKTAKLHVSAVFNTAATALLKDWGIVTVVCTPKYIIFTKDPLAKGFRRRLIINSGSGHRNPYAQFRCGFFKDLGLVGKVFKLHQTCDGRLYIRRYEPLEVKKSDKKIDNSDEG